MPKSRKLGSKSSATPLSKATKASVTLALMPTPPATWSPSVTASS
jgi:hypothetical protein